MQLKWSWGAPDPEPEKSWWALLIEAGELVGEWFCQGFVLFCLRYMSLNELGFWKKYINLTVDVQDVKSRQVGLAITSTFRRGKGCLSEGHLQGETKQGSSICDIMRSCRKSERHKSCQIVFQQIKWHVKLDQFDKTEKALTTTLTAELSKVLWLTAQAHHGCLGGLQISTMQCLCTWCIQDLQAHTHKDTDIHTYKSHTHSYFLFEGLSEPCTTLNYWSAFFMSGESQGQLLVVEYSAKLRVQNHHWGNAISDLVICGARHSGKSTQRIEPEIRMPGIVQQLSESSKSNCSLFWTKIRVDVEILIIFQLDSEHISLWFDDHKKSSRWERLESAASSSCQLQAWRWETQAKDVWLIFFFLLVNF